MKALFFLTLVFLSNFAFAGVDCTGTSTSDSDHVKLKKLMDDANAKGYYEFKSRLTKVRVNLNQNFKTKKSNMDCTKQDCKVYGFCQYTKIVRSSNSGDLGADLLFAGFFGKYKYCVGGLYSNGVNEETKEQVYTCMNLED